MKVFIKTVAMNDFARIEAWLKVFLTAKPAWIGDPWLMMPHERSFVLGLKSKLALVGEPRHER